jgi:amino acid adenylation domain-containing protein/thioester reductase-like protein
MVAVSAFSIDGGDGGVPRLDWARVIVASNRTRTEYPRDATVHELFEAQVSEDRCAIAAVHEGRTITYGELACRARRLARSLKRRGVGPGVPVGIFVERSLPMLVGLLGILMAGGAYVPLDPAYPDERLRLMLSEANVAVLIAEPTRATKLFTKGPILSLDAAFVDVDDAVEPLEDESKRATATDTAYIMFTSGSTGKPKGVAVPHRAIVRLVVNARYFAASRDDRFAQISNLSFDASTFEIWGALLNGARLVILPEEARISPAVFRAEIGREGITIMFLTTALFHQLAAAAPGVFAPLQTLIVGGEALDPKWAQAVLAAGGPKQLINGYGPTENTTFSTTYLVQDVTEAAGSVPIGTPIENSTAYVLDKHLALARPFQAGELYVGGDGVASGYVNAPDLTNERFLPDPFSSDPSARLYRTGDRASYLPDGTIRYLGRMDRQVKINGYRIELSEIESALLACPSVREAFVLVREGADADKRLIAYVAADDADAPALHAYLGAFLPKHLMPSSFVVLPALPLTPNGKIDRDSLPLPDRRSSPSLSAYVTPPQTRTEEILVGIWSDLFGISMIGREDSFFELGGDSLRMARLLLRVRETFGVELAVHQVFGSPRLLDLGRVVDETLSPDKPHVTRLLPDWAIEARLDERIRPCGKPAEGGPLREAFLTGATGFLGAFLLRDLLRHTKARIHCLVRAGNAAEGLRRIRSNLEKYALWDPAFGSRVVAVPGDLTKPLFALSPDAFDSLAARIQAIYHSGAEISYVAPYDAHRAANVLGTGEALRLAFTGTDKPFHHVSSIAVFGPIGHFTGLTVVPEDFELDRSVRFIAFDMGYSQSKWVAEKLCSAARARGGIITVYRPGFIMGDSATGAANHNDFMARLIRGCVMAGAYPDLPFQRKDFVAVDDVSAAIARISLDVTLRGRAYHLVPPAAESIDLQCFFGLLRGEGHELLQLPYAEWLSRIRALCVAADSSTALLPLLPMLAEKVRGEFTRWELHEGMPIYDDSNTRSALARSGLGFRPMNAARLGKYLGWLEQKATLRLGPAHESSSGRRGLFRESW